MDEEERQRLGHKGPCQILDINSEGSGEPLPTSEQWSEIIAEQTRGQGRGKRGLVRCGQWEWHAVLPPGRVEGGGSWVSMATP